MNTPSELHNLAETVSAAIRALSETRQLVNADKEARKRSRWAMLIDWLIPTAAERAEQRAARHLAVVQEQAKQFADEWINSAAHTALTANATDAKIYADQQACVTRARYRIDQITHWRQLASDASNKLVRAADDCSSASTTEMFDLFTTSKAISALSSLETSSAADSVKRAFVAVRALSEALPKRADAIAIELPSDLLDLIVDLAIAPSFDILSWMNMGKLDDASRKCRQVADNIAPVIVQLERAATTASSRLESELHALHAIKAPYLFAAASQVPSLIRELGPLGQL